MGQGERRKSNTTHVTKKETTPSPHQQLSGVRTTALAPTYLGELAHGIRLQHEHGALAQRDASRRTGGYDDPLARATTT